MVEQPRVEPAERPLNWPALIETGLLTITAVLLLAKTSRGVLVYYIHPRYNVLVVVSAVVLLGIALVRARSIFVDHPEPLAGRAPVYLLLLLPLLFGTFVPAQPLGADALLSRSLDGAASARWSGRAVSGEPETWNLLQWASALSAEPAELLGERVRVDGFVFRPNQADPEQFYVARYVVTCCAADGAGVGLPVAWSGGLELPENSWIAVEGTLGEVIVDGAARPGILARSVTPVEQPSDPYLYP